MSRTLQVPTREHLVRPAAPTRPGAAKPGTGPTITIGDITKIVRRRMWLILISLAVCIIATVAGTFVWKKYLPSFSADAILRLVPPEERSVLTMTQGYTNAELLDRYKQSQAVLVKSRQVLMRALESPEVQRTNWYKKHYTADLVDAQRALEKEIKLGLMPKTENIRVSMSIASSNPKDKEELASIVNAVADAFRREINRVVTDKWENSRVTLTQHVNRIQNDLRAVREQKANLVRNAPSESLRSQNASVNVEIQRLTEQITQLSIRQAEAQAGLEMIKQQQEAGLLEHNIQVLTVLEIDPTLRALMNEEIGLSSRKTDLEGRSMGSNHPQIKSLTSRLESVQTERERRRKDIIDKQVVSMVEERQSMLNSITQTLVDVTERRNLAAATRRQIDTVIVELDNLEIREKELNEQLRQINLRRTEMEIIEQDSTRTLPASILSYAQIPLAPDWPRWSVMAPMGVLLGLIIGLGLAFLLEFMDTTVKTPTDIVRRMDLPLLAMIPHEEDLAEEIQDMRLACLTVQHSLINEAYRELRTNLLFSGPAHDRKSLLVTSPAPEDGRTTVAANLAIAMAQNGQRVLLIDANFRRPAIRELFPTCGEAGLSNVLSGQVAWNEVVHKDTVPNLTIMSSGPLPPNPNELLGSELTRSVLKEISAAYDQVIIDGPPLLLFTDGCVLAGRVDGVLIVVRAGANTHGIVQRCRATLEKFGAHSLGVVLNGVRTTVGGYLEKNYQNFYDYLPAEAKN